MPSVLVWLVALHIYDNIPPSLYKASAIRSETAFMGQLLRHVPQVSSYLWSKWHHDQLPTQTSGQKLSGHGTQITVRWITDLPPTDSCTSFAEGLVEGIFWRDEAMVFKETFRYNRL